MKKFNNKGFTILEVIIAMSILSVVILMGYKVINGTEQTISHNKVVYEGQLNTNIVNKYLTNDIERSIAPPESDTYNTSSEENVLYTNFTEGTGSNEVQVDKVEYKVTTRQISETNDKKWEYDLNRIIYEKDSENEGEYIEKGDINLISKQPYYKINKDFKPFSIQPGDGIYTITVNYQENKKNSNTAYKFEVSSRVNGSEGNTSHENAPDGNIIVKNESDKNIVTIMDSVESGYKERIEVTRPKGENLLQVEMDNGYSFNFKVGNLTINKGLESKTYIDDSNDNIDNIPVEVDFSEGNKKVYIQLGNENNLINVYMERDGEELEFLVYKNSNECVEVEIERDGKVEVEVGKYESLRHETRDDGEIEIELKDKFKDNIKKIDMNYYNAQVDRINHVVMNTVDKGNYSISETEVDNFISIDDGRKELNLDLYRKEIKENSWVVINIEKKEPHIEEVAKIKLQHTNKNHSISRKPGSGNGTDSKQSYIDMLRYENSNYIWFGHEPSDNGSTEVDVKLKVRYINNEAMLDISLRPKKSSAVYGKMYTTSLGDITITNLKVELKGGVKNYNIQNDTYIEFTTDSLNPGSTGSGNKNDEEILIFEGIKN